MAGAIRNTVKILGLPLDEAIRMGYLYPAEYLGLAKSQGQISVDSRADRVLLNDGLKH
ncbi:N-acetylglucosamine-6-phosphate deacetylase (fragment) [Shewanella benthica]|uniref:N-acetylglucosamine-6-phosphate deacetylase n=1 Tax=Shewanella benthica TaxID=43661 RepID=A0A330LZC4_9GAMM